MKDLSYLISSLSGIISRCLHAFSNPVDFLNWITNNPIDFLFFITIAVILIIVIKEISAQIKIYRISKEVKTLSQNAIELTPEQFMKMRSASLGGRGRKSIALSINYAGVYILHNKTKNLYYVGQGTHVLNRVNAHFTGHGNGDVYADYKYGDQFTIRTIALNNSGFSTLNELERYCISYYNAFYRGYNKTRGNH